MAFCKAIAIYQEPIYLQFAAGREGAAGGLGGSGCLLSAQRSLAHSLSQGGDLPTLRPDAGARRGVSGCGVEGLQGCAVLSVLQWPFVRRSLGAWL